jgi:hypothetical protein
MNDQSMNDQSGLHDFDFLIGDWTVAHQRLKQRLAGCTEWEAFGGTMKLWSLVGSQVNIDDNVIELPSGAYRAASLRSFDLTTRQWAIRWIDSRYPHQVDPAVVGLFQDGIGTFFGTDIFEGRPIKIRFVWSDIAPDSATWQQAFSDDGGATWETNWVMKFQRA